MQSIKKVRRYCFDYPGLLTAIVAALSTSLLFSLQDEHITFTEALRAFLQSLIAGVAYAQNPFRPMKPSGRAMLGRHPPAILPTYTEPLEPDEYRRLLDERGDTIRVGRGRRADDERDK